MRNSWFKEKFGDFMLPLTALLVFALVAFLLSTGIESADATSREEQLRLTEVAIRRSIVSCYAMEGIYPATLSELEERYGLRIDYEKFYVDYRIFASNIMPEFTVLEVVQ